MIWPHEGSDEVAEYTPESDAEMLDEADRKANAAKGLDPARVKPREDPPTLDGTVKPRNG